MLLNHFDLLKSIIDKHEVKNMKSLQNVLTECNNDEMAAALLRALNDGNHKDLLTDVQSYILERRSHDYFNEDHLMDIYSNSARIRFMQQMELNQRFQQKFADAEKLTGIAFEDEKYDGDEYSKEYEKYIKRKISSDMSENKIIAGEDCHEFAANIFYAKWTVEQLTMMAKFLTDDELSFLTLMSVKYDYGDDFALKFEEMIRMICRKITYHLGIVFLAHFNFNGIEQCLSTVWILESPEDNKELLDGFVLHEITPVGDAFMKVMAEKNQSTTFFFDKNKNTLLHSSEDAIPIYECLFNKYGSDPFAVTDADMLYVMRNKLGLTQRQFATRYNIPIGTYNHWEQGVRKPLEYVMHMLYRVVSDDLLFAQMYDLDSVYAVMCQLTNECTDVLKLRVLIESKDGQFVQDPSKDIKDFRMNRGVKADTFYGIDVIRKFATLKVLDQSFMEHGSGYSSFSVFRLKLDATIEELQVKIEKPQKITNTVENEV